MNTVHPMHPAADPRDAEAFCADAVRKDRWWELAGLPERWPLSTADAARLLADGGEYDVTADQLADLIDRRILPAPAEGEDGPEWNAGDIVQAAGTLEARQQWRPTPSRHDPKKHPFLMGLEAVRQAGTVAALADNPGAVHFDVRQLVQMLVICESVDARAKIALMLRACLDHDHGVIV